MREFAPFIAFVMVAFSGVFLGVANRRGAPISAAAGGAAPSGVAAMAGDKPSGGETPAESLPSAVRLLRDFYAVRTPEDGPAAQSQAASPVDPLAALHADLTRLGVADKVRFMIASLSDPIESSADHFDPLLDAMQRAFEAEGMVIDRHYLPWKDVLEGRGRAADGEPLYRSQPGVVLFRETGASPAVVAVLIVGENPIFGVHKRALHEALQTVARWPAGSGPARIQILGPTYSGSAISLRLALADWMRDQQRHTLVEILSGSAMAKSNKEYLDLRLPANQHGAALVANFHSTAIRSDELQKLFLEEFLVKRLRASGGDIVMLTEANTAYGASARPDHDDDPDAVDGQAAAADHAGHAHGDQGHPAATPQGHSHDVPMRITYPAQIGRMRTAYERQNLLPVPAAQGGIRPLAGVEIRLEENPRASDLPPVYSPAMAAHIERMMMSLLDAVNRENRQYVGLVGTSVEDRLFLAQLIYFRCPNVRLFCLDNNLLYTHPRYNRFFEGMLVASPFPLYPQHHDGQTTPLTSFSSDEANGTYVACRAVISRLQAREMKADLRAEYSSPFALAAGSDMLRPPVWIVQVGRGRTQPVAVLPITTPAARFADLDYTLRLDAAWQQRRWEVLNKRAMNLRDDFHLPGTALKFEQPKSEQPQPRASLHLHGPSPLFRGLTAGASLFVLLMLVLVAAGAGRRRSQPVPVPAPSLWDAPYRVWLRIEWCALAALLAVTHLMLAAPILLTAWLGGELSPKDWLTIAASCVSAAVVALASAIVFREHFRPAFGELRAFRQARLRAQWRALRAGRAGMQPLIVLRRMLLGLESLWEAWAVPVIAWAAAALAVGLLLIALAEPIHSSDRFFLVEQLAAPTSRLSPLVPLWLVLAGFAFIFGTRAMRLSRILGEGGATSRLALFVPWRHAASGAPAVRDATRAIEAVEHQSAIVNYWLAKVLRPAIVILLVATFLFPQCRLTTQPTAIEYSLRCALLGLALLATCLIGSSLECIFSLERFWRNFAGESWTTAFGRIAAPLRAALKSRLFVSLPDGYVPPERAADAARLRSLAARAAGDWLPLQAALTADQQQALRKLERAAAAGDFHSLVEAGLLELAQLARLRAGAAAGRSAVESAEDDVRGLLAPYVAELSVYLLAQLCRRLIGAIILTLILMLALESYPFQPHRFLVVMQLCFVGAAVGAAVWAYLAVNKSAVLSALAGDHAGLTFDLRLLYESVLFLGVPVLTVLSLHFPDFSEFFGSAADAVKGIKL